ncbi:MAG: hypothetical protein ACRC2K_12960 [Clostridium sp.]
MNFKSFACWLTLFSFFAIGWSGNSNDYYKVENHFSKKSKFIENGVKLQYCTINKENEFKRVVDIIEKEYDEKQLNISEDSIEVYTEEVQFIINFWQEEDKIFVEATLINKNPSKTTQKIKKEIEKLQKEHLKNVRYFEYYKGKINTIDEGLSELKLCSNIEKYELLKIENGFTCTAETDNGAKLNFALNQYDTGVYLIIGTPTIFATY